jgi:hypothetical protein
MKTQILWLGGGGVAIFGVIVIYALHRGLNVKASLKILSAVFSFEANEPSGDGDKTLKERGP